VRFFRLKNPERELTQGNRHFCAFQQDMCSDESSTLCQASYKSLSFPTGLYIHGDIYFVCTPPTLPRHQQQITLYCQAPYILLSFPTKLYIHARQFFHTHPSNPYCNCKIKTRNKQINNNAHLQFKFYRLECSS
jgi:hypothetical protein